MRKDSKCKCTLAQSLVGDGCRYCQPQDYIDRLRDEIKDMQDDYDKLFNEKATVWNLTADAPSWQGNKEFVGLSDDEREILYDKAIEMPLANLWNDYAYLIEQALKEKNDGTT